MSCRDPRALRTPRAGGCLCGDIRYAVDAPLTRILLCHCRNCQRASGAAASANTVVATAAFHIVQGRPRLFRHRADSGGLLLRYFCGGCGSPLFSRKELAPEVTVLKVGTLDDPVVGDVLNLWTEAAPAWLALASDAPSHPKGRRPGA